MNRDVKTYLRFLAEYVRQWLGKYSANAYCDAVLLTSPSLSDSEVKVQSTLALKHRRQWVASDGSWRRW